MIYGVLALKGSSTPDHATAARILRSTQQLFVATPSVVIAPSEWPAAPIRRLLTASYAEAVRQGPDGWIDDVAAFRKNWGFDLSSIRVPVRLWHGADDTFTPANHTRWLAGQIPGATLEVQPGVGHFAAVEILPEMLAWLTASDKPTRVD